MTCYDLESKEEILNLTDHWGYSCSAFPSGWSPLKEKKRSFLCTKIYLTIKPTATIENSIFNVIMVAFKHGLKSFKD